MTWPLSQDYNEAIQSPESNFTDPDLKRGEAAATRSACRCRTPATSPTSTRSAAPTASAGPSSASPARSGPARALPGDQPPSAPGSCRSRWTSPIWSRASASAGKWYPVAEDAVGRGTDAQRVRRQIRRTSRPCWRRCRKSGGAWRGNCGAAQVGHCDLQHGNVLLVPGRRANVAGPEADRLRRHVGAGAGRDESGEVGHPATSTRSGCATDATASRWTASRCC